MMSDPVGLRGITATTPRRATTVVVVSKHVEEIRLDLSRERVIRVVGRDRRGTRVERLLKVTGKGRILLV